MPAFLRSEPVEVMREVPRLVFRLFDGKAHFLGFRDRQQLLIYCEQCAVFVVVKPSARVARVEDEGGGHQV